ncbi:MAG: hypothetical protein M3R04_03670, partial [bacterium]|nr:hypothetical protein [bacterium]
MRIALTTAGLAIGAAFALAQFLVLIYTHWYFAGSVWLKIGLLAVPLALILGTLQLGASRWLVVRLCIYWIAIYVIAVWNAGSFDLRRLTFTDVLNYEAAVVWVPCVWVAALIWLRLRTSRRLRRIALRKSQRILRLRRRIRDDDEPVRNDMVDTGTAAACLLGMFIALCPHTSMAEVAEANVELRRPYTDRHLEMQDPGKRIVPPMPSLPGMYPTPLHLREKQVFWVRIDNRKDGVITVFDVDGAEHIAGRVLAPVASVNPNGFTASGWGAPGRVTATSVNAIHIKVDHDYSTGKGVIFSLTPVEFATFDPKAYKSYFNSSSSLFTDIKAGQEIFGGKWAPLVGSRLYVDRLSALPDTQRPLPNVPEGLGWGGVDHIGLRDTASLPQHAPDGSGVVQPVTPAYRPAEGDLMYFRVERLKYNPEWIEFENRFGGIIWVKELGVDAYPIGQVLKPVVGCGRFTGTQYADTGRIRANHPGVIDISTCHEGVTGGFQIIPRDHSMSSEMTNARTKTQWMVVGPLYALDPSWEGLPPLFTDYLYPAWTPSDSNDPRAADTYLSRFTVRARYSD